MPPLPVNNTYRVWCEYTSGEIAHDLLLRFAYPFGGEPDTNIYDRLVLLSNAMFNAMADTDAITGWRYSDKTSLISLPFDGPTGNGTQSGGTVNPESRTGFYGVAARSGTGRHYHANFFTLVSYTENVYRQDYSSLPTNLQNVLDAFRGVGVDPGQDLVGIDEQPLFFKNYMNIGQNAYWQRRQR